METPKITEPISKDFNPPKIILKDHIAILCFVIFSLIVHSLFMLEGFGEVDAANCAVVSLIWQRLGDPIHVSTLFRTSILYLQYLRTALDLGFPANHLDLFMNWTNVITGSLSCIPLFYLWRRITTTDTVISYLIVLFFAPAFWQGSIYGFPHVPALFFFFISLLVFDLFLTAAGKSRFLFLTITVGCAILSVGLKADVILCFGAFCGLVFLRKQWNFLAAASAVIIPIAAYAIIISYSNRFFPEQTNEAQFAHKFFQDFPFSFKAVTDLKNLACSITPVGIILCITSLLAMIYGIIQKKHSRILIFILTWSLPVGFFWAARMSNSSRHMLFPWIPVLFYTALMMKEVFHKLHHRIIFFIILLSMNYFICPKSQLPRTMRPSSRIFLAQRHLQATITQWHQIGKEFVSIEEPQKIILGNDLIVYVTWETLNAAESFCYNAASQALALNGESETLYKSFHTDKFDLKQVQESYPDWKILYFNASDDNRKFELEHPGDSG